MATVVYLAQTIGERPAGSDGEHLAAAWLAGQYSELGYSVRIQPFAYSRRGEPVTGMNIIATKPGDPAFGTLYVGAHYDTVARVAGSPLGGPGANDNASGTATVLEAARVLASEPLSLTVQFIAFGAEEDGLVGSYHFVDQLLPTDKLRAEGMLNLDCVGLGDRFYLYLYRASDTAFAESLGIQVDAIETSYFANSDHISFALARIPAAMFNIRPSDSACGPDYHSSRDTADKLNSAALQRAGEGLVDAIRNLSSAAEPRSVTTTFLPLAVR